ncbi:MAG: hypothetical protein GC157_04665 [Frankiales bacterium]|nr:hypothetical protein [Frankiales bacterium]
MPAGPAESRESDGTPPEPPAQDLPPDRAGTASDTAEHDDADRAVPERIATPDRQPPQDELPLGAVMVPPLAPAMAAAEREAARPAARSADTEDPWDGVVDPRRSSAPAPRVDTGRLYRSSGAEGPATLDAIPAIDPAYTPARRVEADAAPARVHRGGGLTYAGVFVVVGGVTVIAAFLEALLRHDIGVITGVALAASSVYAALVVRRPDIWAAVVVPPLAFLAAALTAGQLTLQSTGNFLVREGFSLFRTLATNAPWILGTTAVCLAIVLVRRRRA